MYQVIHILLLTISLTQAATLSYSQTVNKDAAKDTKKTVESALAATKLNPGDASAWSDLGAALYLKGKLDESIAASQKAIDINPEMTSALGNLVKANGQANHIDRTGIWMARWVMAQLGPEQSKHETIILLEIAKGLQILQIQPPLDSPSDSAMSAYYETHKNDFSTGTVHLGMISCPKTKNTRKFMDELRKKLSDGGDFGEAAREHSDDSAAANGGDRGWMQRVDLRADLADIAFTLQTAEISPVIEDTSHYRILRVQDRKVGSPAPLSEVKEQVIFKMKAAGMEEKIRQWILQAKKELKDSQPLKKK